MITKDHPLLIISWGVFPAHVAMSVLSNNMAKVLGDRCIVVGEEVSNKADWDKPNYQLVHCNPRMLPTERGKDYFKWLKFFSIKKKIKALVKKHNCSAVLVFFPDQFYVELARQVAKDCSIPFIPWMHNTYLENKAGIGRRIAKRLQPLFFKDASVILSISDGLTNYYREAYPNFNFETLVHCFDIKKTNPEPYSIKDQKRIKFALTGSINESCLDASLRICEVILSKREYELHIFGKKSAEIIKANGVDVSSAKVYGFLSDLDFAEKLNLCDFMLLPHGFDGGHNEIEYKTIFPTRTIPYLTINRPILAHTPQDVFLTDYLLENNCAWVISSKDHLEIKSKIEDLVNNEAKQNELIQNAFKASKRFNTKKVIQSLSQYLEQI